MSTPKPRIVLVHGSATDADTWAVQTQSKLGEELRSHYQVIAHDREERATVEDYAHQICYDLENNGRPTIICGSSFGAVVALEAIRQGPLFAGAVLLEPPMSPTNEVSPAQIELFGAFDRRREEQGDEAAAELFLRTVLGDAAYDRMPRAYQDRAKSMAAQIRADSAALIAYKPRYEEMRHIKIPVLLVGGERSAPYFRPTLNALLEAIPDARLQILAGAGHMMHVEAHKKFADLLIAFGRDIGLVPR